jgi:hypothetical protein
MSRKPIRRTPGCVIDGIVRVDFNSVLLPQPRTGLSPIADVMLHAANRREVPTAEDLPTNSYSALLKFRGLNRWARNRTV